MNKIVGIATLAVIMIGTIPAIGQEKSNITHDEHLEAYIEIAKEEAIQPLRKEIDELKSGKVSAQERLKIRKLNQQIDNIKKAKTIEPIGVHKLEVGKTAHIQCSVKVISVIDENQFIAYERFTQFVPTPPAGRYVDYDSSPIWFKGFDTSKLSDGKWVFLKGVFEATGTESYTNALGAKVTVTVIESWTPPKDEKTATMNIQ